MVSEADMNEHLEAIRHQFVRSIADPRSELVEAWTTDPMYDGQSRTRVTLTWLIPPDLAMDMFREEADGLVCRVTTAPLEDL